MSLGTQEDFTRNKRVVQIKDNLLIHGRGKQHDHILNPLLKLSKEYNITFLKEKCHFGQPQVTLFSNVYSKEGMSPKLAKV